MQTARPVAGLHILRFLAALTVVVYHSAFYVAGQVPTAPTISPAAGDAGVWLFFSISGFVMVFVLDRDPARSWRRFAVQRVIRIVPLYWAMTAVAAVSVAVGTRLVPTTTLDAGVVLRSLFFLPSENPDGLIQPLWPVGWTLVFEMAFYALVTLSRALRVDPIVFCAPILLAAAAASAVRPDHGAVGWFYADPVVLFFLAGMLVARSRRLGLPRTVAVLLALATVFATTRSLRHDVVDLGSAAVFLALTGLLLAVVLAEPWIGSRVPRVLVTLGSASYSLYLTHPLVGPIVTVGLITLLPAGFPPLLGIVASVTVSVLAGLVVFRWVEQPLARVLGRSTSTRAGSGRRSATV
ncbi:acyltransferase family protein [Curtobacterium sp. L1-20]|uniref:acyltransferase family protein n=1 Tax=Curtobacterium sp. L1-20 TaxID=3138181 RepID=UPI003B516238